MRPIYYDTETTGIRPGKDRIIEIAAFDPVQNKTYSSLVNPGCPIPSESTVITHITDEMVKNAPTFGQIADDFVSFCEGDTVLIAHNNDAFDQLFLEDEFQRINRKLPPWQFIDSLKWSRKYRSDLPRHSLQFLREVFKIEANQAHRAMDDVLVLSQVFSRMVDDLPFPTVIQLLKQHQELTRMPFGKHQGKNLSDVPKDYVDWLDSSGALDKKDNAPLREGFVKLGYLREKK
jgi:DNA polymerase III subunit epsilon